jgi:hypothetical protein
MNVVRCQVDVSATGRSLVQRSRIEFVCVCVCVFECEFEEVVRIRKKGNKKEKRKNHYTSTLNSFICRPGVG